MKYTFLLGVASVAPQKARAVLCVPEQPILRAMTEVASWSQVSVKCNVAVVSCSR